MFLRFPLCLFLSFWFFLCLTGRTRRAPSHATVPRPLLLNASPAPSPAPGWGGGSVARAPPGAGVCRARLRLGRPLPPAPLPAFPSWGAAGSPPQPAAGRINPGRSNGCSARLSWGGAAGVERGGWRGDAPCFYWVSPD